jgi:catechol 2,3-dioxygenase-like lactoylglutathione lyase family enzyme
MHMDIKWLFAGVPVADYAAALAWYKRLMGRAPDFIPEENEAVWQVVENGWIYIIADPGRAGKALITLMVDDLDRLVAELEGRGVPAGTIETQPGLYRIVEIPDPEGNRIRFGQALGPGSE